MVSRERKQELLRGLQDAVVAYDEERVVELSKAALGESVDAYEAVMSGLAAGMEKVGELYVKQEYFVPELLLCSDALYAGLDILRPQIKVDEEMAPVKRQIVIGTVEGDIHDIGKNLVKVMFEAAGWIVHDLGSDVKLERFIEEQLRTNSDIVGLSALMTTSMLAMQKVIPMIREQDLNVAIMVGGAPLTRDTAKLYGADGYADNAGDAVRRAVKMLDRKREGQAT
jgi:methanogenic corrinoid protein MtbC1